MHQYVANRNVFRDCLKLFPPIIGFRKLSGMELQTNGLCVCRCVLCECLGHICIEPNKLSNY